MTAFISQLNVKSDAYAENRREMLAQIARLQDLNGRAETISERRKERFEARGQLTPRERMQRLLDPGMPFLAIGNLAGYLADTDDEAKSLPGSTVRVGIGFISGVRSMIVIDDSGIQSGALTPSAMFRIQRGQDIALRQKLPFVHLVESAGGDLLNYAVEGFVHGGAVFANLARLSKAGVPVVALLNGSATAGGAYMPGMSDYVIAVRDRARAFLAGPPLLKAATGEIAGEEELGGADMHAMVSGLVEYLADDDAHGVALCREVMTRLNWNERCATPPKRTARPPLYDPDDIAGLVPLDYRKPYDARELVARVVDGSEFMDFKPRFGPSIVCLQGDVFGMSCGFICNNGPIDPNGAAKAAQFLQLCDQAEMPVVFMQNITGYIVGKASERAGMIKHGAKMIQAVTNVSAPRITFMIGASFGAGNYGMCGRGYDPDFIFTWPNARTGVMGGEQAAKTMQIVTEGAGKKNPEVIEQQTVRLKTHFSRQESAFYTSGRGLDDGMIDPRRTRECLGFLLETVWEARNRSVRPNSFGVARF